MMKYRVAYGVLFIALTLLFIWKNSPVSFALLLFCIIFPLVLHIWMRLECKRLCIRIGVMGDMKTNRPVRVRVAATGRHRSAIGRISGDVSFRHVITEEADERSSILFERGNMFAADYEYQNAFCGVIIIRAENLKAVDSLGLTTCKIRNSAKHSFVIYPEDEWKNESNAVKIYGDEFIGVREYREGDVMSSVHWKLSSKWDRLLVREYTDIDEYSARNEKNEKCRMCENHDLCYNKEYAEFEMK